MGGFRDIVMGDEFAFENFFFWQGGQQHERMGRNEVCDLSVACLRHWRRSARR